MEIMTEDVTTATSLTVLAKHNSLTLGTEAIMTDLTLKMLRLSLSKEPTVKRTSKAKMTTRIAKSKPISKQRSGRKKPEFVKIEDELKAAVSMYSPISGTFTFCLPESRTRWLQLASRVRLIESPEGSKVQPTNLSRRSSSVSVKSSRRAPRTVSNTLYMSDYERQSDTQRFAFKPFRLLDLPLEMRQSIYRSALQPTNDDRLFLSLDRKSSGVPRISRLHLTAFALLSSSRQIREEGLPLLYQTNHFYARAIRHLPRILSLPDASKHIRELDVSFAGKTSRLDLFKNLNCISGRLRQLKTLNLTFDYTTLAKLSTHIRDGSLTHQCKLIFPGFEDEDIRPRPFYADTFDPPHERSKTRKLKITFRHATVSDMAKKSCVSVLNHHVFRDCIVCAVISGNREHKLIESAQAARRLRELSDTEGDREKDKEMDAMADRAVPVLTVLRSPLKDEELCSDGMAKSAGAAASTTEAKGAYKGLNPVLAPEPRACTDWKGRTALKPKTT